VIESPVCTPIGSRFSIEQTITALSAPSRITSSSNSFQPAIDSSISTSLTGARRQRPSRDVGEPVPIVGEAAPASTQGERRPDDHGEPERHPKRHGLLDRPRDARPRDIETGLDHRALEPASILRLVDRLERRAEHPDAQPAQVAGLRERDAHVQTGLAAERRQQRVGSLSLEDLQDGSRCERARYMCDRRIRGRS
jgi:hypothetical protein